MTGHVHKRGKTWTIVYDEGVDEHGKRRQRTRGGYTTKKEAEKALAGFVTQIGNGDYVTSDRLTLREFVTDRWLPVIRTKRRPATILAYEQNMRLHILPRLGGVKVQALDASMLNRLYAELLDAGKSKRTVQLVAAIVSAALEDARRWRIVVRNVARDADAPVAPRRVGTTWTRTELTRFLSSVEDHRLYALWRFLALTGARRGEALGLTWRALSLEDGRASIEQALVPVGKRLELSEPKTKSALRKIELDAGTAAALAEHRKRQLVERALFGDDYLDDDLVFCHPDGRPLAPGNVSQLFVRLAKDAGLPRIRLHDLRHGVATMALAAQIPAEIVRRRLGHANIGITLGLYSHAVPELESSAAETLAALIDV